jgi:hypothetical protein
VRRYNEESELPVLILTIKKFCCDIKALSAAICGVMGPQMTQMCTDTTKSPSCLFCH